MVRKIGQACDFAFRQWAGKVGREVSLTIASQAKQVVLAPLDVIVVQLHATVDARDVSAVVASWISAGTPCGSWIAPRQDPFRASGQTGDQVGPGTNGACIGYFGHVDASKRVTSGGCGWGRRG